MGRASRNGRREAWRDSARHGAARKRPGIPSCCSPLQIPSKFTAASGPAPPPAPGDDQFTPDFFMKGHFPDEGTEGDLSTTKCLANFFVIVGLTAICIYLTLFSTVWFKVYVVASCAYLSFITYYSVLPPQLVGSPEGDVKVKKVV